MLTLVVIAPDGAVTRNNPVMHGPQILAAVSHTLRTVAPWLTRLEADRAALTVARGRKGITQVHTATGYRFRIETTEPATA